MLFKVSEKISLTGILFLFFSLSILLAQELKPIVLPSPQTEIGKPLMQALLNRHSTRVFDSRQLSLQELANLLWAAYGINRPESSHRTVPSAMNWQEYDVYVVLKEGVYIYNAKSNCLEPVTEGDMREFAGKQDFVKTAPLNLIYVSNYSRISKSGDLTEDQKTYSLVDAGFIAENVYLYCASQGLAAVVRGMFDHAKLTEILKLKPEQKVILTQTVGYPK
jgi:SagB-type dehydrogenase family enzyme